MTGDDLRGMAYIILKDMKTYYLKPPAVSWGIVFPVAWILAFYLRSPQEFGELVPGLIAMTILFSTTAVEAVVFNLELRLRSFERLLLAPVSATAVFLSKILGGVLFGLLMTAAITLGCILVLQVPVHLGPFLLVLFPSLLAFASLGALLCIMVKEVFEAQTLLNLPRFLMIFLSGVVYPVAAMPSGLQYVAYLLPLTYSVHGIQQAVGAAGSSAWLDTLVLAGFCLAFLGLGIRIFKRRFA